MFLLEPSLNVAVEQQALARVHRFGQTRPVRIVRFICHDTVEVSDLTPIQLTATLISITPTRDVLPGRNAQPGKAGAAPVVPVMTNLHLSRYTLCIAVT